MTKEQQKDKIIEIVKKAIDDNSVTTYGEDDMVAIDGDDVDHIAEEVAEEVYNFYHPIDEVAEYKPDEDRRFSDCAKSFAEKLKKVIHERDYIQGYAEIGLIEEIDELLKEYK